MKLKKLKVLLPALTGMLLTNGPVSILNSTETSKNNQSLSTELKIQEIKSSYIPQYDGNYNMWGADNYYFLYNESLILNDTFSRDFMYFCRRNDDPSVLYFYIDCENKVSSSRSCVPAFFKKINGEYLFQEKGFLVEKKVSDFLYDNNNYYAAAYSFNREDFYYDELPDITVDDKGFKYKSIRLYLLPEIAEVIYAPVFAEKGYVDLTYIYNDYAVNKDEVNLNSIEESIREFIGVDFGLPFPFFIFGSSLEDGLYPLVINEDNIPSSAKGVYSIDDLKKKFLNSQIEIISNESPDLENDSNVEYNSFYFNENFDIRKFLSYYLLKSNSINEPWCNSALTHNKRKYFSKYIIGNINKIKLYKNNTNSNSPSILYVDFDLYDFENDTIEKNYKINFLNCYLDDNFQFNYFGKDISNEEILEIGYSKRISDLMNLCSSNFINKLDNEQFKIVLDGVNYNESDKDTILYDIVNKVDSFSVLTFYLLNNIEENNGVFFEFKDEGNYDFRYSKTFYINWLDDISPEVSGDVLKYRTSNKDNFKFKELFKANDEKDGDVSESIELIEEEGKYFIKAKDAAGNESKKEILLDIDPVLYENINVINDEKIQIPENILLTKKRFEKILTKIHGVEPQDVDIIPYVNNCKTKGTYKVSYKINEETKEMDFEVIDPIKKNPEPGDVADQINEVKDTFIGKVKTFFNKLGNWFRGVFTKWRFDCYITNEEWDTRFN